jgi:hypothetical protein
LQRGRSESIGPNPSPGSSSQIDLIDPGLSVPVPRQSDLGAAKVLQPGVRPALVQGYEVALDDGAIGEDAEGGWVLEADLEAAAGELKLLSTGW